MEEQYILLPSIQLQFQTIQYLQIIIVKIKAVIFMLSILRIISYWRMLSLIQQAPLFI
jgi:hypothetical protein